LISEPVGLIQVSLSYVIRTFYTQECDEATRRTDDVALDKEARIPAERTD